MSHVACSLHLPNRLQKKIFLKKKTNKNFALKVHDTSSPPHDLVHLNENEEVREQESERERGRNRERERKREKERDSESD